MEHTISLHDSNPEPSPESFDVTASYDSYEEPTPLHAFVAAAEPVSDGWVQEDVPDEFEEPEVVQHATHEHHESHEHHAQHEHHPHHEHHSHHEHEHEHHARYEPVHEVVHEPVSQVHEIHAVPEAPPAFESHDEFNGSTGERRVVLRMTGGETVELRRMWDEAEAVAFAREAVRRIADAEQTGEWPELDGRFLRPDQIFSVDIQVAE
jgi:hypothetical protein